MKVVKIEGKGFAGHDISEFQGNRSYQKKKQGKPRKQRKINLAMRKRFKRTRIENVLRECLLDRSIQCEFTVDMFDTKVDCFLPQCRVIIEIDARDPEGLKLLPSDLAREKKFNQKSYVFVRLFTKTIENNPLEVLDIVEEAVVLGKKYQKGIKNSRRLIKENRIKERQIRPKYI